MQLHMMAVEWSGNLLTATGAEWFVDISVHKLKSTWELDQNDPEHISKSGYEWPK